jgi:glucan phosphoethanolaminetransferase (alkaline phosphatase superfamily)
VKSVAKDINKFVKYSITSCIGLGAGIIFWILWGHDLSVSVYSGLTDEHGITQLFEIERDEISLGLKLIITALIGIAAFLLAWFLLRFWGRKTQEREIVH